jgi:hypothetical protein
MMLVMEVVEGGNLAKVQSCGVWADTAMGD